MHRPWTVLKCVVKNALARMGVAGLLRDVLGLSDRAPNWANLPMEETYGHVMQIFSDLTSNAGIGRSDLEGRTALEIGPGHNLGVALMLLVHGCRRVYAVERAATLRASERSSALYRRIVRDHGADPQAFLGSAWGLAAERVGCFEGIPFESFQALADSSLDLIYSHEALEHVSALDACFANMARLLRPGGLALHVVNLSGHGEFEDLSDPIGFLRYPSGLWGLMFSHRAGASRLRFPAYLAGAKQAGLEVVKSVALGRIGDEQVRKIRPLLAREFSALPAEELAVTRLFLMARKPA